MKGRESPGNDGLQIELTYHMMDSFILTFVKHGSVRKDKLDCFDMHIRPF